MFTQVFETIIVGVDFSPYSKIVVKQAIKLSQLWKAKLAFVHAYNEPFEFAPSLYVPLRKPLSAASYVDRIKKTYGLNNLQADFFADHWTPGRLIRAKAKKYRRPLIMVGYKAHGTLMEAFFGSTAQNLALKSKTPVWIQRGKKIIDPSRILIPHDLSKESNRSINFIKKLKMVSPLSYLVFFVRGRPFPVLDYQIYKKMDHENVVRAHKRIKLLLAKYPKLPFVSSTGDVTEKIVRKTKDFDLIVMSHHPVAFYSASETRHLIKNSKVPILVLS